MKDICITFENGTYSATAAEKVTFESVHNAINKMMRDRMDSSGNWYSSTDSAESEEPVGLVVRKNQWLLKADYCDVEAAACWVYLVCAIPGNGWKPQTARKNHAPKVLENQGGRGIFSTPPEALAALSERLRRVKIHCGDWLQSLGNGSLLHKGKSAVFLDPPYEGTSGQYTDSSVRSADVRRWAIEHGETVAVVLCGHEAEHGSHMPQDWDVQAWSRTKGATRHDERFWASPACSKNNAPSVNDDETASI